MFEKLLRFFLFLQKRHTSGWFASAGGLLPAELHSRISEADSYTDQKLLQDMHGHGLKSHSRRL
eukprot:5925859-Amphidinium_carterae.1